MTDPLIREASRIVREARRAVAKNWHHREQLQQSADKYGWTVTPVENTRTTFDYRHPDGRSIRLRFDPLDNVVTHGYMSRDIDPDKATTSGTPTRITLPTRAGHAERLAWALGWFKEAGENFRTARPPKSAARKWIPVTAPFRIPRSVPTPVRRALEDARRGMSGRGSYWIKGRPGQITVERAKKWSDEHGGYVDHPDYPNVWQVTSATGPFAEHANWSGEVLPWQ